MMTAVFVERTTGVFFSAATSVVEVVSAEVLLARLVKDVFLEKFSVVDNDENRVWNSGALRAKEDNPLLWTETKAGWLCCVKAAAVERRMKDRRELRNMMIDTVDKVVMFFDREKARS